MKIKYNTKRINGSIYSEYQDNILKEVSKNMTDLVHFLNNLTTTSEQETVDVDPLEVSWNVPVNYVTIE